MFLKLFEEHPGKFVGIGIGLLVGFIYLFVGFWKTLIFIGFVALGLYLGKKFDNREDIRDVLEQLIPEKFLK